MKNILNILCDFWYRIAYSTISFNSLKPHSFDSGSQNSQESIYSIPSVEVKNQSKWAFFIHPPAQVTYRLKVPQRAIFRTFVALLPESWGKNPGGVEFNISVSSRSNGYSLTRKCLSHPTKNPKHRRWILFKINLHKFANQDVDLTLNTTIPSGTNTEYAWAIWGNPGILSRALFRRIWSYLTSPFHIIRNFINFLISIYLNSFMIRNIVVRDIKARYVGSLMGVFWSVIHPLTQLLIYYFVFSVILKIKLGPGYENTDFAIWLVAGLLLWTFFAEVVTRSPAVIVEQSQMITKMVFPSEILPFTQLLAALINHLIGLIVFICFLIVTGYGISTNVFLTIPALLITSLFALGISWMLSALNVFLRDIGQIIGVFVNIWFFLTPIIYPRHIIPEALQKFYGFNPMLHIVEVYRAAIFGKTDVSMEGLSYFIFVALFTFAVGGLIFRKLKPAFADVL